jgi:hypothetical protein
MTEDELHLLWRQANSECGIRMTTYPADGVLAKFVSLLQQQPRSRSEN